MKLFIQTPVKVKAFKYTKHLHSELAKHCEKLGLASKTTLAETLKVTIKNQEIGEAIIFDKFIALETGVYFNIREGLTITSSDYSTQIKVDIGKWIVISDSTRTIYSDEYFMEKFQQFIK